MESPSTGSSHTKYALRDYQELMRRGAHHHNEKSYQSASQYFQGAKNIIQQLFDMGIHQGEQLLRLKVACYHNLSAAYTAQGKHQQAEQELRELHQTLMQLCTARSIARNLRVAALGALDNSLFNLTSCLGLQGKLDALFAIITYTEQTAEIAAEQLLH